MDTKSLQYQLDMCVLRLRDNMSPAMRRQLEQRLETTSSTIWRALNPADHYTLPALWLPVLCDVFDDDELLRIVANARGYTLVPSTGEGDSTDVVLADLALTAAAGERAGLLRAALADDARVDALEAARLRKVVARERQELDRYDAALRGIAERTEPPARLVTGDGA